VSAAPVRSRGKVLFLMFLLPLPEKFADGSNIRLAGPGVVK
jgi:hypothetical protein